MQKLQKGLIILFVIVAFTLQSWSQTMEIDMIPKSLENREGVIPTLGEFGYRNYYLWQKVFIVRYPSIDVQKKVWNIPLKAKKNIDSSDVFYGWEIDSISSDFNIFITTEILVKMYVSPHERFIYSIVKSSNNSYHLRIGVDSCSAMPLYNFFDIGEFPQKHIYIKKFLKFANKISRIKKKQISSVQKQETAYKK